MVSTKMVIGSEGVDNQKNEKEDRLFFFGNNMSVHVYRALADYRQLSCIEYIVE